MLQVTLFGAPRIERDGQIAPLRRSKALALLAYLAVARRPQDRDGLLALLWPEFDPASARNNLRRELSLLKAALGEEALLIDRRQVTWNPHLPLQLDVADFQAHVAAPGRHGHQPGALCEQCLAALTGAAELCRDEFMAGFSLPDAPAFDEWLFFQRESFRQQLAELLQALIAHHRERDAHGEAITYARRWLALDTLHEPAHRELMRLYAAAGQRSAALRQFDECAALLERELGAAPEPETVELHGAIRARRPATPALPPPPPAPRQASAPGLPPAPVGFVGRRRELQDVVRRLTDPACRLLTLTGPGGIGKTHLALQAARLLSAEWADALPDGVLFVPLVAASGASEIISAIAAAAGFDFYAGETPLRQLSEHLRPRRMLIVLDNFEQLLEAAPTLSALLEAAPGLRFLVTSRVALNLPVEWFHPVEGLSYPNPDDAPASVAELAHYDAVRLFEQSARRVRGDFMLSQEREAVVRLCRLVEGAPLALELAASWLKMMTVAQVADAVASGLDILTARDRYGPERHRSMRIVMEQSWALLGAAGSQDEAKPLRPILARLAIFNGDFDAAAAAAVAGATLDALASLVEQSLLRSSAGRFQLHELLRQFAAERLAADPEAPAAWARHRRYYLTILAGQEPRLLGPEQRDAIARLAPEALQLRAAWLAAIDHGEHGLLDEALLSCFSYFSTRSRFQEGEELFAAAVAATAGPHGEDAARARVRARSLIRCGAFRALLGDYELAERDLRRGIELATGLQLQPDIAEGLITLGNTLWLRGDAPSARRQLDAALAIGEAEGEQRIVAQARTELAWIAGSYGEYEEARRQAEAALALSRANGWADLAAAALRQLAWSTVCLGAYAEAEAHQRESLMLLEALDPKFGVRDAVGGLGWVAWCAGGERLPEARGYLEHALALSRDLGQRLAVTNYLGDLGLVAIDGGDLQQAEAYGREGLAIARELDSAMYVAYHLCILGHVAGARGEFAAGRRLLAEALRRTWEVQTWPMVAQALFYVAELLLAEAAALESQPAAQAALRSRARSLLASVAASPVTWQVYRARARRRLDALALPAEQPAACELDWATDIEPLVAELAPPFPLEERGGGAPAAG
jgi:DNA-binding SARP family transcriptional activator/predicted ATPase